MPDPVRPGERFRQRDAPGLVWRVETVFEDALGHGHALIAQVDDPVSQKTVAVKALSDSRYFQRDHAKTESS